MSEPVKETPAQVTPPADAPLKESLADKLYGKTSNSTAEVPPPAPEQKTETDAAEAESLREAILTEPEDSTSDDKTVPSEEANEESGEKKPDDKKSKDVPEKYDLKLPENSLLKKEDLDAIAAFSKEQGYSQAQAEKLLLRENSLRESFTQSFVANQQKVIETNKTKWFADVQKDPELGGEKFKETAHHAELAVKTYGNENIKKMMNASGLGNHPEVVRMFAKIGKALDQGRFVQPGNSVPSGEKDFKHKLYPELK